jgi:hypothetical protein
MKLCTLLQTAECIMQSSFAQSMSNMKLKPCATLKFNELGLKEFVTLKKKLKFLNKSRMENQTLESYSSKPQNHAKYSDL